jgi:hypothetical protein
MIRFVTQALQDLPFNRSTAQNHLCVFQLKEENGKQTGNFTTSGLLPAFLAPITKYKIYVSGSFLRNPDAIVKIMFSEQIFRHPFLDIRVSPERPLVGPSQTLFVSSHEKSVPAFIQ